ncbi:MAG: carboxymuconolactone decarboxylase [Sulfobacillus benefaciens]|uniref:Carboxymuconolactone decarboxylase n=1 Tax=Sulfobacillus benefaciens TaxID=453960 RepID=A0A2T2XIY8_9FIRM|nr:MAG: carboxymuconolactone decarboxylase [Sulfobacillus benefaciens]
MEKQRESSRYEAGLETLITVDGLIGPEITQQLGDLGKYIVEFAFGDIYRRENLALRDREMITVAILTVLGRESQLQVHLQGALNVGVSPEELKETVIQTVPYAGFPTAINAMRILQELLEKHTAE